MTRNLSWKHSKILAVSDAGACWLVFLDDGFAVGIGKHVLKDRPLIGETLSVIARGSRVKSCAIGEKVLWDNRAKQKGE